MLALFGLGSRSLLGYCFNGVIGARAPYIGPIECFGICF